MSFHVQVSRSLHRAQVFNLGEEELRRRVLEPWSRGSAVVLGDRHWDPAKSTVLVLEGPALDAPELAHGQGWNNARRRSQDVTLELFGRSGPAARSVAVFGETPSARSTIESLVLDLGLLPVEWAEVRQRILAAAAGTPSEIGVAAAVLALDGATPPAAFEAGLALGALGARAIVAQLGSGAPPGDLADVEAIRLGGDEPDPLRTLGERLQRIGCRVGG